MDIASIGFTFSANVVIPQRSRFPFRRLQECTFFYDGERLFSGYCEQPSDSFDGSGSVTSLSGGSKTMMLAYSAVEPGLKAFKQMAVNEIVTGLVAPYGISVATMPDWKPEGLIKNFRAEAGQALSAAIGAIASQGSALVFTLDGESLLVGHPVPGDVAYTLPSSEVKLLSGSLSGASSTLGSVYHMIGSGRAASHAKRSVSLEDPEIPLHRVVVLQAEKGKDAAELRARLERVRRVRIGRSLEVSVKVPRWTDENGQLFRINTRVRIRCELLRTGPGKTLDEVMVISQVTLTLGEDGETASLQLRRIDSYLPEK